jgi:hypothetical protein
MDTVVPILARIALLQQEIVVPTSGSVVPSNTYITAEDNVPYSINPGNMPLFVNYVGPLVSSKLVGSDERGRTFEEVRQYKMVLYYAPFGSGTNDGEKYGELTAYFDPVYNKFGAYPRLRQLIGVQDAVITTDSGAAVVRFQGTDYYGITFTLQVTTRVRRTLTCD